MKDIANLLGALGVFAVMIAMAAAMAYAILIDALLWVRCLSGVLSACGVDS